MATVATMAVNVIAQTGGFDKGLDKASKKAKGFGSGIKGAMGAALGPAALAAAAIAAVGVALVKVNEAMARLDETGKKARSMGIATQKLMELQHAAQLAGLDANKFNTTMQKLQKGIGEALAGVGMAGPAFDRLGIDLESLATLPLDEQFHVVSEAIAGIQNPAERSAAAVQIFGRSGMDLIAMMEQGSDAIKAQGEDLKDLQGTMSESDIAAVEASNDAWTRVGSAMEGVWNQAAVFLAPIFEVIANVLAEVISWVANGIQWFRNLGEEWTALIFMVNPLVGAIKWMSDAWGTEENVAQKAAKSREAELAAAQALFEEQAKAAEEAAKAREALEKKGVALAESLRTPMEKFNDTIGELNTMLDAGVINWETYGRAVEKAQEDIKKSEEFAAKEIKVAERQSVGVALRGRGAFSIQQKQQRALEKIREEERLQLIEQKRQTALLQQLNTNIQTGTVVTI